MARVRDSGRREGGDLGPRVTYVEVRDGLGAGGRQGSAGGGAGLAVITVWAAIKENSALEPFRPNGMCVSRSG